MKKILLVIVFFLVSCSSSIVIVKGNNNELELRQTNSRLLDSVKLMEFKIKKDSLKTVKKLLKKNIV